jgi:CDP-diacylglycerol--glycerol-3-phosphate 3-phosphatidyltransferase
MERSFDERLHGRSAVITQPIAAFLTSYGIIANWLTGLGVCLAMLSGYLLMGGQMFSAGLVLLAAAACDGLDGPVARYQGQATKFGSFLDSVTDRCADLCPPLGFLWYAVSHRSQTVGVIVVLSIIVAVLIPYSRAKAEALGCRADNGWLPRGPRLGLTITGCLGGVTWFIAAATIITVLGLVTISQRLTAVYQQLASRPS